MKQGYFFYQKTIGNMIRLAITDENVEKAVENDCDVFLQQYKWYDRELSIKEYDGKEKLWEVRLLN